MSSHFLSLLFLAPLLITGDVSDRGYDPRRHGTSTTKFTFMRVEYDSVGGYGEAYYEYDGRLWQRWQTDYPAAEQNFLIRLQELTTVEVDPVPKSLRLTDEALFNYPFIYMCDVGWQVLDDEEVESLRRYLNRGGFLWVDDFWGIAEWDNLYVNMKMVFPDLEWRAIPKRHPILNVVFPLEECPQVPAKIFWEQLGLSYDDPGIHRYPHGGIAGVEDVNFKGLFDADGRLMAVATHNSDIGDGWERESESLEYFEEFSTKSYAMGVNIVVYALTH